jgi:YD repeat-containing protein
MQLDGNGNVVAFFDRNNRPTSYSYDGLNRITKKTDAARRDTTWTYSDDVTAKTTMIDPLGLATEKQTDALGRPLQNELRLTLPGAQSQTAYTTSYFYDNANRAVTITDPRGTSIVKHFSAFGDVGDIIVGSLTTSMQYTPFGAIASYTDANRRTTTFSVDPLNRMLGATYNDGFSESYEYDDAHNIVKHTDRRGVLWQANYDNIARPLETSVGSIKVRSTNYLDSTSTEEVKDALQQKTTYKYDLLRRVISITNAQNKSRSFAYDGINLVAETDFKQQTTRYSYDAVDRLTQLLDRANTGTNISHSDSISGGHTMFITDRRGNNRLEVYDALERLQRITTGVQRDGTGNITGGEMLVAYEYDGNDNLTAMVDGRHNRTRYDHDGLNRVTLIDHAGLQNETIRYDGVGNVLEYNDGFGGSIVQTFDALDHVKTRRDGAGNTSEFVFDGEGLLTRRFDAKRNITDYEYNGLRSLIRVIEPTPAQWNFGYDDAQNLISVTDALNHTVSYG